LPRKRAKTRVVVDDEDAFRTDRRVLHCLPFRRSAHANNAYALMKLNTLYIVSRSFAGRLIRQLTYSRPTSFSSWHAASRPFRFLLQAGWRHPAVVKLSREREMAEGRPAAPSGSWTPLVCGREVNSVKFDGVRDVSARRHLGNGTSKEAF